MLISTSRGLLLGAYTTVTAVICLPFSATCTCTAPNRVSTASPVTVRVDPVVLDDEPEEPPDDDPDDEALEDPNDDPDDVVPLIAAAGALVGAVAVSALGSHMSPQATAASLPSGSTNGTAPGDGRFPDGAGGPMDAGGPGGFGGVAGEQRLQGTLAGVRGSAITVKTASGSATYTVTGTTEIVRNGSRASLSDLKVGDPVFVHVYPSASSGAMLVERIFAGTLPAYGGGFGGGFDRDGDRGRTGSGTI